MGKRAQTLTFPGHGTLLYWEVPQPGYLPLAHPTHSHDAHWPLCVCAAPTLDLDGAAQAAQESAEPRPPDNWLRACSPPLPQAAPRTQGQGPSCPHRDLPRDPGSQPPLNPWSHPLCADSTEDAEPGLLLELVLPTLTLGQACPLGDGQGHTPLRPWLQACSHGAPERPAAAP